MGEVIDFPMAAMADESQAEILEQDPYYRFIHTVLSTADSYGFLPFTVDSAAEHVYKNTRHNSQLAKLLDKKPS